MSISTLQVMALADAESEIRGKGLQGFGGIWSTHRPFSRTYSNRTINELVDMGLLKLWAGGKVAYITEAGVERLEFERAKR